MPASQGSKSPSPRRLRQLLVIAALTAICLLALGAGVAGATVRYAAPGGTGKSPCPRANPCPLFVAASLEDVPTSEQAQPGDEVVALPGEYAGTGDLGPGESVSLRVNVDLHGDPGSPRPIIRSNARNTVLAVNGFSTVSDLEIIAPDAREPVWIGQSAAERLVVRTAAEHGIACLLGFQGVLRDSVCVASGRHGAGAGSRVHTTAYPGNTRTLRNVTAVASGPESAGILFTISGGEVFVDVKSTIARGTASDVEAIGSGPGGGAFVFLENSAFATRQAVQVDGGLAFVTAPGEAGNVTATPLLAGDDFHQLPGSPTIDQGIVDATSGMTDVDGGARVVGGSPDIGADEWVFPTTTRVACTPTNLHFGQATVCSAEVDSSDPTPVGGSIGFAVQGSTGRTELGSCQPVTSERGRAGCKLSFPLPGAGNLQLTATFSGDPSHGASEGSAGLGVAQNETSTALSCDSTSLLVDSSTKCSITVIDAVVGSVAPTGLVQVGSTGPGRVQGGPSCGLSPSGAGRAGCQITYTPTALGSGLHEIWATYDGDEGHHTSSSSRLGLAISSRSLASRPGSAPNMVKPNTILRRKPARRTRKHRAVFVFGSEQAGARFKCKLDRKRYRPCQSPLRAKVATGRHVFKVKAVGVGGVDPTPAAFHWVVRE